MRTTLTRLRLTGLLGIAASIAVATVPVLEAQTPLRPPGITEITRRVPQTFTFRSLDGTAHRLSEFKGKVVIVNVWGTWCAACIVELPSLQRLHAAYNTDPDVAFVLLSQLDEPEKLRAFVSRQHLSLPVYYIGEKKLPDALTPVGWPSTFLIDRSGIVRGEHFGGADWSTPVVKTWIDRMKQSSEPKTIPQHAPEAPHSAQQ